MHTMGNFPYYYIRWCNLRWGYRTPSCSGRRLPHSLVQRHGWCCNFGTVTWRIPFLNFHQHLHSIPSKLQPFKLKKKKLYSTSGRTMLPRFSQTMRHANLYFCTSSNTGLRHLETKIRNHHRGKMFKIYDFAVMGLADIQHDEVYDYQSNESLVQHSLHWITAI